MSDKDYELFEKASNPRNGIGVNYFTGYYFGRTLTPWQFYFHHARQQDITVIGGVGSGKTTGAGLSLATWAIMTPRFVGMNLAPTMFQAKLMADIIMREASGNPVEKFIYKYTTRPYPIITFKSNLIGESKLIFLSASDDAKRIQGVEVDTANIDEAGQILNPFQLMGMVASRMRGNVQIGGGYKRQRLKRLSMVTASYLEAPPWLWARMDAFRDDPEHFLSMSVKSQEAGTLSEEDLELYMRRIPKDQQAALMDAEKPEGAGKHITLAVATACEDLLLNRYMNYHTLEKTKPTAGWRQDEWPGAGCVRYEKPPESDRVYLMAGDPGQGTPPHRNAGVIIVLDISEFPDKETELVYFDWVDGRGSYEPFKASYKYAWDKYHPVTALVDSSGQQSLWNEQILFNMNIWAEGMNFSGQKAAMLVSLQQILQRRKIKYPYIQGLRSQLVKYDINNDKKLDQDIVATLMMLSFYLRNRLWEEVEEQLEGKS